ncbi:hypothetical protein [Streptomyces sp. A0958]|uniref:hypothetical protein n=1 Tax=Streptomyces sp. A0958 TaxID=2563101 RepID=UPI0019D041E2|nr:hypothetical protein [Streptomyces sp. A0958]
MLSQLAPTKTGGPHGLLRAAGALVGATIPQLGALSAARRPALLRGPRAEALPTAFALESPANGLCCMAGPALVTGAGAALGPAFGMALATALVGAAGWPSPPSAVQHARRQPKPSAGTRAVRCCGRPSRHSSG